MRVYKLDEHLECTCGHEWDDHHHGVVMNMEYNDYPLNINGLVAQECEYNQHEGYFTPRHGEETMCRCRNFKPRAFNVQKIVDEWVRKHEEQRKNGRQ